MKVFFLATALFFLTVSCTSCVATKIAQNEEYTCEVQHNYLFNEIVDHMLLEACYSEMLNQCHPEDRVCHFYGQLLCTREALRSKLDGIDTYLDDECYRGIQ